MPETSVLRASPKLVLAHYHPQYTVSFYDQPNATDYYTTEYLRPSGFDGAYREFGGYMRNRPSPRAPLGGDFQLEDMKAEVERAVEAGIDGFIVDAFDLSDGYLVARARRLVEAAESVPGFKIVPMTDFSGLPVPAAAELARRLHEFASSPAVYRLPGNRLVVSPWRPEASGQGAGYWRAVRDALSFREGAQVALVPTFLDLYGNAQAFAPIVYGMGSWGGRSVATTGPNNPYRMAANYVHSLGKVWMQAVSAQDMRVTQQVYWEAGNTENLRYTWNSAIDSADWVQMATWNDYGEGTGFAPSLKTGSTFLDISSYYLARFKTGTWPRIIRNGAYLTHRVQFAGATPNPAGGQTKLAVPNLSEGQSVTPRNTVEVLSFLTSQAWIVVTVGAKTHGYLAPAGVSARLVPLGLGSVSMTADGPGVRFSAHSPDPVRDSFSVQDLGYRGVYGFQL